MVSSLMVVYGGGEVKLSSGNWAVAMKSYEKIWPKGDGYGEEWVVSYSVRIPELSQMANKELENSLNKEFESMYTNIVSSVETSFNEMKGNGFPVRIDSQLDYQIVNDSKNYLSILFTGYDYFGGAHGMPNKTSVNVDISKGKKIGLKDLFKEGVDYKKLLIDAMNRIRILSPEEDDYSIVSEVTYLPEDSFYIKDGNLVIYYQPYELAPYARGFVDFSIPIESLEEFLDFKL